MRTERKPVNCIEMFRNFTSFSWNIVIIISKKVYAYKISDLVFVKEVKMQQTVYISRHIYFNLIPHCHPKFPFLHAKIYSWKVEIAFACITCFKSATYFPIKYHLFQ